jgi:hypothetical protein
MAICHDRGDSGLYIRNVFGSILDREVGYPNWDFSYFVQLLKVYVKLVLENLATAASCCTEFDYLVIFQAFIALSSQLLTSFK